MSERHATMRSSRIPRLYAITPDECYTNVLVVKVLAALSGGATLVQHRNKSAGAW